MRAFPLAGLVVGLIVGAILVLAAWLGAPPSVAALIAVGAGLGLTGALHEDGLADVADGFGGGATRERKLEIMRDSRIGTYGVLALILAVALKATVLATLAAQSVWLAFRGHRGGRRGVARRPGRHDALAHARPRRRAVGRRGPPGRPTVIQAVALRDLISVLALWPVSLLMGLFVVPLSGLVGLLLVMSVAQAQIGGQTGDVAGASQVVSELAILIAAVMVLTP
jgi:adenosylcobinamide-GDP ribazoletransferase